MQPPPPSVRPCPAWCRLDEGRSGSAGSLLERPLTWASLNRVICVAGRLDFVQHRSFCSAPRLLMTPVIMGAAAEPGPCIELSRLEFHEAEARLRGAVLELGSTMSSSPCLQRYAAASMLQAA